MKTRLSLPTIMALLLQITLAAAQPKTAANTLAPPPTDIKIDGSLQEWGDSLRYYNEEKKLNFTLANDKDNIYIALRLNDRSEQTRLLNGGLTISIDTKGKKKEAFVLTYPVPDPNTDGKMGPAMAMRKPTGEVTQADRDALVRERLTKLHNIKVTGFKDIEGDMITTTNTYGIKAAVDYDANGYLVYEACIPLKFFGDFKADKDMWAFNFKINGVPKPAERIGESGGPAAAGGGRGGGGMGGGAGMGGGGMRGGGGGRRGGGGAGGGKPSGENTADDRSELFKSIDFWEKFYLVK
jgi:hypothetical protein